ncbi:2251_t:CDS:2, partial [Ambispora leptoticha]
PNWNDPSSIYAWIQTFSLNRGRNRLVKTFGRDFELFQRDDTINMLWNGDRSTRRNGVVGRFKVRDQSDKFLHPVPVLAGGPGTGKSRFLDEIEKLLKEYAEKCNEEEIRNAFANMTVINTTYGNGSSAEEMDIKLGAQTPLAIRILFEYFGPQHDYGKFNFPDFRSLCDQSNISRFTLSTALQVVYADILQKKQATSHPLLVM